LEQTKSNLRVQDRGHVKKTVSGKVSRKRSKGDVIEIFGYQKQEERTKEGDQNVIKKQSRIET